MEEGDNVDLVRDAMFSADFVLQFESAIRQKPHATLMEFQAAWWRTIRRKARPMSLGLLFGYWAITLQTMRQNWLELLPELRFDQLGPEWNLAGVDVHDSHQANPSIRHVVRRIRNSLGHGSFSVIHPAAERYETQFDETYVVFRDRDPRTGSEFSIRLTVNQTAGLVKRFHEAVFRHVAAKVDVEQP